MTSRTAITGGKGNPDGQGTQEEVLWEGLVGSRVIKDGGGRVSFLFRVDPKFRT